MLLKLLKLKANDAISSGDVATRTSGNVTRRKICVGPPPSTSAASFSSSGIDCSAPIETRKKYGTLIQKLTRMTATFAQLASKSHGMLMWKRRLTTPKSSFSSPCQTRSERKLGTAHGIMISERYVRWKLMPFLFRTIASSNPAKNDRKTVEA